MSRPRMLVIALSLLLAGAALAGPLSGKADVPAAPVPVAGRQTPGARATPTVLMSDAVPVEIQREGDPIAPEAFAVSGATVYLADQLHQTVRRYVSGKFVGTMTLGDIGPVDLQVTGSTLTALESEGGVHTFRLPDSTVKAAKLTAVRSQSVALATNTSPNLSAEATASGSAAEITDADFIADARARHLGLFNGQLVVDTDEEKRFRVESASVTELSATSPGTEHFEPSGDGFAVLDAAGRLAKRIALPHTPVSAEALHSGGGYDYYYVCDEYFTQDGAWMVQDYVFRFTAAGAAAGVYTLARSDAPPANRHVQVADGRVYQLVVAGKRAQVLELKPDVGSTPPAKVKSLPVPGTGVASASGVVAAADDKPKKLPLIHTLFQSVRMANLSWTFKKATNGSKRQLGKNKSAVRQPRYLAAASKKLTKKKKKSLSVKGYPYTWGGYDSLNTSSVSGKKGWKNFTAGVKKGRYTGNTSSKYGNQRVPNTIGLDCSGLVSAVFQLGKSKKGTSNLVDGHNFKYVAANEDGTLDIKRGDLLIHEGHVVVVVYVRSKDSFMIGESTNTHEKSDRVMHWKRYRKEFSPTDEKPWRVARYQNWDKSA